LLLSTDCNGTCSNHRKSDLDDGKLTFKMSGMEVAAHFMEVLDYEKTSVMTSSTEADARSLAQMRSCLAQKRATAA